MNPWGSCVMGAALLLAGAAQAARPLATEDGELMAAGRCELDGEATSLKAEGSRVRGEAFDLACALSERTQADIGWLQSRPPDGRAQAAALGFKTQLWTGEGEGAPSLALAGTLAWAKTPGSGWAHAASDLRLGATLPALGSKWHASIGHLHDHLSAERCTDWGLAWELEPVASGALEWAPMAEFTGDDRRETWFNAGLRFTAVADRLWLDISVQRQVAGGKARGLAAGFKFAF